MEATMRNAFNHEVHMQEIKSDLMPVFNIPEVLKNEVRQNTRMLFLCLESIQDPKEFFNEGYMEHIHAAMQRRMRTKIIIALPGIPEHLLVTGIEDPTGLEDLATKIRAIYGYIVVACHKRSDDDDKRATCPMLYISYALKVPTYKCGGTYGLDSFYT